MRLDIINPHDRIKSTMPKLSDQLRQAIRASGFPLARLCEQIGIDHGTGSRFMASECGLALDTVDRVAEVLGLTLNVPTKRRFVMLATMTGGQPRLRFINNVFTEIVHPPVGKAFSEWEDEERQRLRKIHGADMTLSHYTCDILVERPTDSVGLKKRRKTIPSQVFDKYGPKASE
jgi:hypothetical protein